MGRVAQATEEVNRKETLVSAHAGDRLSFMLFSRATHSWGKSLGLLSYGLLISLSYSVKYTSALARGIRVCLKQKLQSGEISS